jgi:hypothetical protein
MTLKRVRYRFWLWVHGALEKAWHWVYYKKVLPLQEPWPEPEPVIYSEAYIPSPTEVTLEVLYSSQPKLEDR